MKVFILLGVFLLHTSEVIQLLVETVDLAFILNYFVFIFFQLISLIVQLYHLGLQLILHRLDFAHLDLDKLLLRLLFDVHRVDTL